MLLLGFTRQGYQCEVCGLNVHRQCQLQASLRRPCPGLSNTGTGLGQESSKAATEAATASSNDISDKTNRASTPLPQSGLEADPTSTVKMSPGAAPTLPNGSPPKAVTSSSGPAAASLGIGNLDLELLHAHRCSAKCVKLQQEIGEKDRHCMDVLEGDSYCRVRLGDMKPKRTRTVYQTANPRFDESWKMGVPHYRAVLIVELIDAAREKPIGRVKLSTFSILQKEADAVAEGREMVDVEVYSLRDGDKCVGFLRMKVSMQEDSQLFLAAEPRHVPKSPQEDFGLDNLRRVLDRLQAVVGIFKVWKVI